MTNELSGDENTVIGYEEGDPVTRGQWLEILARVGALARADGLELEISEDPLTGENPVSGQRIPTQNDWRDTKMSDKPLICAVRLPDDVWAALSLEGGIYVCPDGADLGAGVEWDGYTDPQRALMCWPRARWA